MAYCVGLEVLSWIVDAQRLRLTIIVLEGGGGGQTAGGIVCSEGCFDAPAAAAAGWKVWFWCRLSQKLVHVVLA